MIRYALTIASVGCAMTVSTPVFACATCFGAQDSPQTQGMNMAIFAMLGTTYTLFAVMIATAFLLRRKSRREPQTTANEEARRDIADGELSHG